MVACRMKHFFACKQSQKLETKQRLKIRQKTDLQKSSDRSADTAVDGGIWWRNRFPKPISCCLFDPAGHLLCNL